MHRNEALYMLASTADYAVPLHTAAGFIWPQQDACRGAPARLSCSPPWQRTLAADDVLWACRLRLRDGRADVDYRSAAGLDERDGRVDTRAEPCEPIVDKRVWKAMRALPLVWCSTM